MIYAYIAASVMLLAGGFVGGSKYVHAQWDHEKLEALQEAQRQAQHVDTIAASAETARAAVEMQRQTIIREVQHVVVEVPLYRNLCIDDAGLRLAAAAISGAASEPAPALRAASAPD